MENTGKVLFEDDSPQWYVALGERWIGPLAASDVYQRVLSQEISWAHFVWKQGQTEWKRLCDVKAFQAAVPPAPQKAVQAEVKEASRPGARKPPAPPKPVAEARDWFLFYNEAQYGPFSTEEISRFLQVGKIHGKVHTWKDGMADWALLESIESFADDVAASKKAREQKKAAAGAASARPAQASPASTKSESAEQRGNPRRPIVAKILLANDESVIVGVCRDISVGGMQVLTDRVPGSAGARIKMNVSPAGKGDKSFEPFVAEGVIVRVLEDGRGFSFRFGKLPDSSRKIIESYIHANAD